MLQGHDLVDLRAVCVQCDPLFNCIVPQCAPFRLRVVVFLARALRKENRTYISADSQAPGNTFL